MKQMKQMKRNKVIILYVFVICSMFILQACASSGSKALRNETESSVQGKLTEGKTTKAEVKQTFGSPLSTSYTDGGLEIWKYELAKMHADAVNFIPLVNLFGSKSSGTKKELTILFDNNDVVKKYNMSESPVATGTGVFR